MQLSKRIVGIEPSATLALNARAQQLREEGKDIISLALGEPDFATPAHIREAAKAAIDEGFTHYTAVGGIMPLREAASQYFAKNYQTRCSGKNIIVGNGGKQNLYNLMQCLLNKGDEVLVPSPYWVSYPTMVELAGGVPVFLPTEPEQGFLLTPELLAEKIGAKTKVLILNTPSNPTGSIYTQEQLECLIRLAVSKGVFVLADEIYDQLVYSPAKPSSAARLWNEFPDSIAVVNGLAKSFAMTGWRVGYTLAAENLIEAMTKLQSQSSANICSIAQKAALAALSGSWDEVDSMRSVFQKRRDFAFEIVQKWQGVVCKKPQGAFYLFPKVSDLYGGEIVTSAAMCDYLLKEAGVALVAGAAFGDDRCFRISYALDDKTLVLALERIGAALAKLGR